jgi:hypothetical protein
LAVMTKQVMPTNTVPKPSSKVQPKMSITSTAKPVTTVAKPAQSTSVIHSNVSRDMDKFDAGTKAWEHQYMANFDAGLSSSNKATNDLLRQKYGYAQQDALDKKMKDIEGMLRNQSDSFLKEQESQFAQQRDQQLASLQKAYADAVANGEMSVREAEEAFKTQSGEIEKQAYLDSEASKLNAEGRGIGNSQQFMGMMASDNAREMGLHNSNQGARDKRVADIRDRIKAITTQRDLDLANVNNQFANQMSGARAQAQGNLMQGLTSLFSDDLASQRDYLNNSRLQTDAQKHQKAMQDDSQLFDKVMQDDMQLHDKDIEKLRHNYTLEVMAKEFGYDIKKMDRQQIQDLAKMAKQHGYDMIMQNDAQSFESSESAKQRAAMARATAGFASNPAVNGTQNAVALNPSQEYDAIRKYVEQLKRTANPSIAPVAPIPGSVADENKQRRIFDIWNN